MRNARMLRNDFDRRVAAEGITRSQWTVIAVVASRPGSSQREIAELLDVTEAAAGRSIDKLCGEGLLRRKSRATDKRTREIYLTDAAQPVLEKIDIMAREADREHFVGFDVETLAEMAASLDRLHTNLSGSS